MKTVKSFILAAVFAIFASTAFAGWDGSYYTNDTDAPIEVTVYATGEIYTNYGLYNDWMLVTRQVPPYSAMDFWYESHQEFFVNYSSFYYVEYVNVFTVDLVSG